MPSKFLEILEFWLFWCGYMNLTSCTQFLWRLLGTIATITYHHGSLNEDHQLMEAWKLYALVPWHVKKCCKMKPRTYVFCVLSPLKASNDISKIWVNLWLIWLCKWGTPLNSNVELHAIPEGTQHFYPWYGLKWILFPRKSCNGTSWNPMQALTQTAPWNSQHGFFSQVTANRSTLKAWL